MGGKYRSTRLLVRGPPATGRFQYLARGRLCAVVARGRLRVVAARGSPARGHRPRVARGRFFSRARRRSVSPRGETDRGD
ncbi:hypothetical protein BHE74_00031355, partial [Ensete ventricosum]